MSKILLISRHLRRTARERDDARTTDGLENA
jgi:hypothetical protein